MSEFHLFKRLETNSQVLNRRGASAVIVDIPDEDGTCHVSCVAELVGNPSEAVASSVGVEEVSDLLGCNCALSPTSNVFFRGAEVAIGNKRAL